jgi:hypothetical protein
VDSDCGPYTGKSFCQLNCLARTCQIYANGYNPGDTVIGSTLDNVFQVIFIGIHVQVTVSVNEGRARCALRLVDLFFFHDIVSAILIPESLKARNRQSTAFNVERRMEVDKERVFFYNRVTLVLRTIILQNKGQCEYAIFTQRFVGADGSLGDRLSSAQKPEISAKALC